MPAKDIYHDTVITVLKKEGWVITDDRPLKAKMGIKRIICRFRSKQTSCSRKRRAKDSG